MNKLKTYEAPSTRVAKVELRTNLLAASIMEEQQKSVTTKGHETGDTYNFEGVTSGDINGTTEGGEFSVSWD